MQLRNLVGSFVLFVTASTGAATYTNPDRAFHFDYDENVWDVVPGKANDKRPGEAVDKSMADRMMVTVQRKLADDKHHARFSVVVDPVDKFGKTEAERLVGYQKHAVEFMKGQRFHIIEVKKAQLGKLKYPAFEILAHQRDFGLYFRQVVVLVGQEAYLLTAAARTAKFPEYAADINHFFDTFALKSTP